MAQAISAREIRLIQSYLKGLGYQVEITGEYNRQLEQQYRFWAHANNRPALLPQYVEEIAPVMLEQLPDVVRGEAPDQSPADSEDEDSEVDDSEDEDSEVDDSEDEGAGDEDEDSDEPPAKS